MYSICFCYRQFRIIDDDGSRSLDFNEFKKGVHDFGIEMEPDELKQLFDSIDKDGSGSLDFDEFLKSLRVQYYNSNLQICTG